MDDSIFLVAQTGFEPAYALLERQVTLSVSSTAPCIGERRAAPAGSSRDGLYDQRMTLTPAQQRNAVSEGAALGIVLSGRTTLPHDKLRIDLAFAAACRGWSHAGKFPRVATDLRKGSDGLRVLTHADDRRQTFALYWDNTGRELHIRARQADWDPTDESEVQFALNVIGGDVPLEGWMSLAVEFLTRMDR